MPLTASEAGVDVGALEGPHVIRSAIRPRCSRPSGPNSIMTAAISSSASVAQLKPPVSTSMTTGRNCAEAPAMSGGAGESGAVSWRQGLVHQATSCQSIGFAGAHRHELPSVTASGS